MEPKDIIDDYAVEDPKKALKEAKKKLKQSVTQKKVLNFTSSKKIIGVDFWNTISKLDNNDVIFTLNEPIHFRLNKIEFDGPVYREETHEDGTKSTKKKRHGLAGALIGTALAPGVGTLAGAIVGNGSGKDNGKNSTHTTTTRIEEQTNIRLYLENAQTHESIIAGILGKQIDYQELLNFKAPEIVAPDVINNVETDSTEADQPLFIDNEIAELRKFKKLVDDGIITQEDFEAKKKKILGI